MEKHCSNGNTGCILLRDGGNVCSARNFTWDLCPSAADGGGTKRMCSKDVPQQ